MENQQQPIIEPNIEQAETPVAKTMPFAQIPKKNLVIIAILVLITIVLLIASLFPKNQVKQKTTSAIPTPTLAPYVKSSLSLSSPNQNSSGKYSSNVEIATAGNQVTGVEIDLSFDPKVLTDVAITPGTFFTNPNTILKKIDPAKGLVTYTLFADAKQKSVYGKGTVAVLSFSIIPGVKTASSRINVLPATEAIAIGQFQSVLKTATGTTFSIK
jgi:hypothetical protein